jgi:DNA-binding PadR family transcriptional regulator
MEFKLRHHRNHFEGRFEQRLAGRGIHGGHHFGGRGGHGHGGESGPDGFGRGAPEGFGRGGRGGRGLARVFDHGELRLVVLGLIGEAPRHGYEIIKAIEERVAGSYSPSPGVIYPTLTLLQELGHVTSEEQGGKKLYTITAEGQRYLDEHKAALKAVFARMAEVHARHGGGMAPQLLRAMENLKLSLRLRMGRGPLDAKQLQAVTDALDVAAQTIERS